MSAKTAAAQRAAISAAAARGIAAQRAREAARQTPAWVQGMQGGPRVSEWSVPTQHRAASSARPVSAPDTQHTFTGHTVRTTAALVGMLLLLLGFLLGHGLQHAQSVAQGQQSTGTQPVAAVSQSHRSPDGQESAALDTARNVTGGPCALVWNVDGYEVTCFPSSHATPGR